MKPHIPRTNDRLSEIVRDLTYAPTKDKFLEMVSQFKSRGECKTYFNHEGKLPEEGIYVEIFAGAERDRVLLDMSNLRIFTTRNHYGSFYIAGEPEFARKPI